MGEAHHAVFVGIGSGEKSGTAGAAGGVDAEVLAEKDALFGEMLEIWGCDGMAIGLDVAARIVGMEIEDIGGGIHNLVLGVMTLSDAPVEHYEWGGVQGQVENCHWGQDACAGEKGISPELLLGIGLDPMPLAQDDFVLYPIMLDTLLHAFHVSRRMGLLFNDSTPAVSVHSPGG